mmetsp:Transcript_32037/g.80696  ORF Transcript_32037/g.80696 Transcript_32037/m.80696 type:complete len:138 (+) Transcript_32037:3-416(+)
MRCLQIHAHGTGIFGKFSLFRFLCELAVIATVLNVVNAVVQNALTIVYKWTPRLRHVYYLTQIAAIQFTPKCSKYEGSAPWEIAQHLRSQNGLTSDPLWSRGVTYDGDDGDGEDEDEATLQLAAIQHRRLAHGQQGL